MGYMPPMPKAPIIPSLPQQQSPEEQEQRKATLANTQAKYVLSKEKSDKNPLGIPLLLKMPTDIEKFNDQYNLGRGVATVPILANIEAASHRFHP